MTTPTDGPDERAIADALHAFANVQTTEAYGYTFYFHGDERKLPFVTVGHDDNEHDTLSQLSRPGVYRLNVGVSRESYVKLLGAPPTNETVGALKTQHDYTALDVIMPHPDYAPLNWFCVLNPSTATFEKLRPLIAEAYDRAVKRDRSS